MKFGLCSTSVKFSIITDIWSWYIKNTHRSGDPPKVYPSSAPSQEYVSSGDTPQHSVRRQALSLALHDSSHEAQTTACGRLLASLV